MNPKILPAVMMVEAIVAAVPLALSGDWRRAGYWLCAAGITFFVTF